MDSQLLSQSDSTFHLNTCLLFNRRVPSQTQMLERPLSRSRPITSLPRGIFFPFEHSNRRFTAASDQSSQSHSPSLAATSLEFRISQARPQPPLTAILGFSRPEYLRSGMYKMLLFQLPYHRVFFTSRRIGRSTSSIFIKPSTDIYLFVIL
jgi:hypothetical protein